MGAAHGVLAALRAMGRTDVLVYSADGSQAFVDAIIAGEAAGTAAQQTFEMGARAANVLLDALLRATSPAQQNVVVDPLYVTADNAATFTGF